jgi:tetratricopeptide (TPR) repeat protein
MKGSGLSIGEDSVCDVESTEIKGFGRGLLLSGGSGKITMCNIRQNQIGVELKDGSFKLLNNNIFNNKEKDIVSEQRIVLCDNYLGSAMPNKLNISGKITIKSLFDAPFPHGRRIVLIEDKEISAKEIEERFKYYKVMGEKAFSQRRYGDAYQYFEKALSLKKDKDVYLYLAYTQMAMGEMDRLDKTFNDAIRSFPYEVRLYQIYVRYLVARGDYQKALSLLEKAIRMNPGNKSLIFMKEFLQRENR